MTDTDLKLVLEELRALRQQVDAMERRAQARDELWAELSPVARLVMKDASAWLAQREADGSIAFVRELGGVAQRVMEGFGPEDVRALSDNIVFILRVVRRWTEPRMLSLFDGAGNLVATGGSKKGQSVLGILKRSRDPDVRRGMGVALGLLRELGKGAARRAGARDDRNARLQARLGPSRSGAAAASARPAPARLRERLAPGGEVRACEARSGRKAEASSSGASAVPPVVLPGVSLDAEGFFADAAEWSEERAAAMAEALGIPELTDAHWQVLHYARADYEARGQSPNVRRLSTGSGLATKAIYGLFPKAPGKTVARIAGIPKPGGCI